MKFRLFVTSFLSAVVAAGCINTDLEIRGSQCDANTDCTSGECSNGFCVGDAGTTDTTGDTKDTNRDPATDVTDMEPCSCDTGVCDPEGGCVPCLGDTNNSGCTDQVCLVDPTNSSNNKCVNCTGNSKCTNVAASVCDPSTNECAACSDEQTDCSHLEGTPFCNNGTCRECVDSTNQGCGADAPKCTDGSCGMCDAPSDCMHLDDTKACNVDGKCVECVTSADCGGKVCDTKTNTCTDIDVGTTTQCEPCQFDEQCATNHHCVPLTFSGEEDYYCLRVLGGTPCPTRYTELPTQRTSINGTTPESYCGIDEGLTTCDAVLANFRGEQCAKANEPATRDPDKCPDGSRCEWISNIWQCTYKCTLSTQCAGMCGVEPNDFCR